jgi:hypothetical protein
MESMDLSAEKQTLHYSLELDFINTSPPARTKRAAPDRRLPHLIITKYNSSAFYVTKPLLPGVRVFGLAGTLVTVTQKNF